MKTGLLLTVIGIGILIAATPDGIFNGADLAAWVFIGLGIHRILRRAPRRRTDRQ